MRAHRNWGLITSGATFQALVEALVCFEDPKAKLFGRPGPDGGQDVLSGDGKRVFQAKHHQNASSALARADAKQEAEKIGEYRKPSHNRYEQWKGVTAWRLVTNAAFNPEDKQKWDDEVIPLFTDQGLTADYWGRSDLDVLLDKHPEVDRSFFQNETRVFLTLPEICARLPKEEPFLQRDDLGKFCGRQPELGTLQSFLDSDDLFVVVHGAGGTGKTRLLVEGGKAAADKGWHVLWANVSSMEHSQSWFEAIVPERPTLLLVDEPADAELLQVLSEQLGGRIGRTTQWKVATATRSSKDPVLQFLFGPRIKSRVLELPLSELSAEAAEEMCNDLLGSGSRSDMAESRRQEVARVLAKRFSCHPVWLTLAVHELEKRGDLSRVPTNAKELADVYLGELVKNQEGFLDEQLLSLLRWLALLGKVNREDDASIQLLADKSGLTDPTATKAALAHLVERRALTPHGARQRLIAVQPGVVRDHLLREWLSVHVGHGNNPILPSPDAKQLVEAVRQRLLGGTVGSTDRSILTSLAETELMLRLSGSAVPLLDPIFDLQDALGGVTAVRRKAIAEALVSVAAFRPKDTAALCRFLRTSKVANEEVVGFRGSRQVGHDDIVLELAWTLYHAAMGANTEDECARVLEELGELAEAETEIAARHLRGLPNDGKRATSLIRQIIEGGPVFRADFGQAANALALRLLDGASEEAPPSARATLLEAILGPTMSIERHHRWSEGYTLHSQTSVLLPAHPGWTIRAGLLERVKQILADDAAPLETRTLLWELFAKAHWSARPYRTLTPKEVQAMIRRELLDNLKWALPIARKRCADVTELAAARKFWHWHCRFDEDDEIKSASGELERIYEQNDLAKEFESLLSRDDWKQGSARAAGKAAELAAMEPGAIDAFIERGVEFWGEQQLGQLSEVFGELGALAETRRAVRDFSKAGLARAEVSARVDLGVTAVASWVASVRNGENPSAVHGLVGDLVKRCGSASQKIHLIERLYGRPRLGKVSGAEHKHVRSLQPLFLENDQGPSFIGCIGWALDYEWPTLKSLIEATLEQIPHGQTETAVTKLINAIYVTVRDLDGSGMAARIPPRLGPWLLDQVLRVPDVESLGESQEWQIEETLKLVDRPPLEWLPQALRRRRDMEAARIEPDEEKAPVWRGAVQISGYVKGVSEAEAGDPAVTRTIGELLDLAKGPKTVEYYFYKVLRNVDPNGLVVPTEVARRTASAEEGDELRRLARIGCAYLIGSQAWRTIAKPVLVRAAQQENVARHTLYDSLVETIRSWSSTPGEVPAIFETEVAAARRYVEAETDQELKPFWQWRLKIAETELREQEEEAKEKRGE